MKNFKNFFAFLFALVVIVSLAACGSKETEAKKTDARKTDATTTTKATHTHVFADEFTCHDRACTVEGCDYVEVATTQHTYGVVLAATCETDGVSDGVCTACGFETEDVTIPKTGHIYADDATCHERTCTVEGCEHVEAATTDHTFGEWTVTSNGDCTTNGSKSRTCSVCETVAKEKIVNPHTLDENGVCTICNKKMVEVLILSSNTDKGFANYNEETGIYSIDGNGENGGVYCKIRGVDLQTLKDAGYTTITLTCINPALPPANETGKCKCVMIAADSTDNLWAASTCIENGYYDWLGFYNGYKTEWTSTTVIDLETYAGRDVHIYTDKCNFYPTYIVVNELMDFENKACWVADGDNGVVEYVDGQGWIVSAKDATKTSFNASIPAYVLKAQIANGMNVLTLQFKDAFAVEGYTNEGSFVNSDFRVMPKKASDGSDDWAFAGAKTGKIVNYAVYNEATGLYSFDFRLDDPNYDYTKSIRLYFVTADADGNATTNGFIANIEFLKLKTMEQLFIDGTNGEVEYVEGKGFVVKAIEEGKDFNALLVGSIVKHMVNMGYTKLHVVAYGTFGIEGQTSEGNLVNTHSRFLPKLASDGSDDWMYTIQFISQYGTQTEDGGYEFDVDLLDPKYDWTKNTRFYVEKTDVLGKTVTYAYFALSFTK